MGILYFQQLENQMMFVSKDRDMTWRENIGAEMLFPRKKVEEIEQVKKVDPWGAHGWEMWQVW